MGIGEELNAEEVDLLFKFVISSLSGLGVFMRYIKNILILVFPTSILFFGDITAQEIDKKEFYFSMDCIVNQQYFTKTTKEEPLVYELGLYKKWRSEYYKKIVDHWNEDIKIDIPLSLADSLFTIKKGYYCVIFKNSILQDKIDVISDFYSKTIEGTGTHVFFSLHDTIMSMNFRSAPNFIVISDTKKCFSLFDTKVELESVDSNDLEKRILNYLSTHKNILSEQAYVFNKVDTTLSNNDLKKYILNRYILSTFHIKGNNAFIVKGKDKIENDTFEAIIFNNKINFLVHSNIQQIIKINSEYYFLVKTIKPSTGIIIYILYKSVGSKLQEVFSDGSYSN